MPGPLTALKHKVDALLHSRHSAEKILRCWGSGVVSVKGHAQRVGFLERLDVGEGAWGFRVVCVRGHVGHGVQVRGACEGSGMGVWWARGCVNRHSAEKFLSFWGPVLKGHEVRVDRQACG